MQILFIGFGAVAKCVCHTWNIVLNIPIERAVIIEPQKKEKIIDFPKWLNYVHIQYGLTEVNYEYFLNQVLMYFGKFDLVIDLSVYVDSVCMIDWSQKNNIPYISTAIECWENTPIWANSNDNCPILKICKENTENPKKLKENSLQYKQRIIRKKYKNSTTTALIDMGQNPGCVSIYVKCALDFLCDKYQITGTCYGEKAMKLGLETIHIAETDSQITNLIANDNVFYNTWSSVGYVEESIDSCQIGIGSHETNVPTSIPYGNQILLPNRGINVFAKSFEPMKGEFIGRLIPHSENNTLTDYLQFSNYKPSTYYVYNSSKISQDSLEILKKRNYVIQPNFHVLNAKEIINGFDSVGVLLLFRDKPSFWYGSIVTNDYVKNLNPNINATTIQVAAGVLGGIDFILKNPGSGICWPEDIKNHQEFIDKVKNN